MGKKKYVRGGNPYMPLWEHVPDGEPRVFTYGGETRLYVYGSHDTKRTGQRLASATCNSERKRRKP